MQDFGETVDFKNLRKGKTDWATEVKGKKLNKRAQAYIDSLPRVETKSAQNEETLAELREQNFNSAGKGKLSDSEWIKANAYRRKGKVMHHLTFINKLRAAGLKCWYNTEAWQGIVGLRAIRKGYEQLGVQFVCGVKVGYTTEYDIFHYDQYGVELNRKYIGWRSCLIQLIARGYITETQANQIFGKPQLCEASELYRKVMWQIRAGGVSK